MATGTQQGYLIIADISGYTAYLTGTELEHAQDILSKLIQTILDACRPPIELVELEGDAVYVYLPGGAAAGQTVLDAIEGAYFAFAARREAIARGTACVCQACRNIPTLDLKFVVHYGEFVVQRLAGRVKPLGPDVILVHRLLKNRIAEEMGLRAYIFFTDAALARLGLDATALGLRQHGESYEHLGEVTGAVEDLAARWESAQATRQVRLGSGSADLQHSVEVPAPPAVVWEYLTAPTHRIRWQPGLKRVAERQGAAARVGVGSEMECDHGDGATAETILDWRPFEYFTTRGCATAPLQPNVVVTTELSPSGDGTRVTWYCAPGGGWRARLGLLLGRGRVLANQREGAERLRQLVATEWQPAEAEPAADPAPSDP
jgi:uncharacterized protein YndB with AHSA1/START domain